MEARACSRLDQAGPGWTTARLSPQHSALTCRALGLLRPHRASRRHGGSGNGAAAGWHSEKSHDQSPALERPGEPPGSQGPETACGDYCERARGDISNYGES